MYEILESCLESQEYIELYTNRDEPTTFIVGKIIKISGGVVAVSLISASGEYDGIVCLCINEVFCISRYTEYINSVINLKPNIIQPKIDFIGENILYDILEYISKNRKIATIRFKNNTVYNIRGRVNWLSNDICEVSNMNDIGDEDGVSCFYVDCIAEVSCDSSDENVLEDII